MYSYLSPKYLWFIKQPNLFVFQEKAEDTLHKMVSNPKLLAQGSLQEALITPIPSGDFFKTPKFPRV
jgi:hypothetical protein